MKNFFGVLIIICSIFLFSSICFAESVNEIEPNDSPSLAQSILMNNTDPARVINGDYTGQEAVHAKLTDTSDEDWYKVNLPANPNTILGINSTALDGIGLFEVYDESLNLVVGFTYHKNLGIMGATPFYVNIPTSGNYYVRVSSSIVGGDYIFTIGKPDYTVNSYTYTASGPCTLTPTIKSVQATYDLRNITSIPSNAVVYALTINGTKTNSCTSEARSIKLQSDSSWITTPTYTWNANVPVSSNKILRSNWVFKLDGNVSDASKPYSLVPAIRFSYVYAVLPQ